MNTLTEELLIHVFCVILILSGSTSKKLDMLGCDYISTGKIMSSKRGEW